MKEPKWFFVLGDGSRGNEFDVLESPAPVTVLHRYGPFGERIDNSALQPEMQIFYLGRYLDSVRYSKCFRHYDGLITLAGV